jgi:recombination protein RecA
MDAIISGRAGVALLVEGDSLQSFEVDDPHSLRPRHPAEVRLLFAQAPDLRVYEDITHEEAARRLEHAADCADALDLALILLDPKLPAEDRAEAAPALEALLGKRDVGIYLEKVIYARPLPEGADREVAASAFGPGLGRLDEFLELLKERQPAVRAVRRAWEMIPASAFDAGATRDEFQHLAVERGFFRHLVKSYPKPPSEHVTRLLGILAPPSYLSALARWREALAPFYEKAGGAEATDDSLFQRLFKDAEKLIEKSKMLTDAELYCQSRTEIPRPPETPWPPRAVPEDLFRFQTEGDRPERDAAPKATPSSRAISTSLLRVDALTGVGGLPLGQIVQFFGLRGVGKRSLASLAADSAREEGVGVAHIGVFNDALQCRVEARGVGYESQLRPGSGEEALSQALQFMVSANVGLAVIDGIGSLFSFGNPVGLVPAEDDAALARGLYLLAEAASSHGVCVVFIDDANPDPTSHFILGFPRPRPTWPALHSAASMRLTFQSNSTLRNRRQVEVKVEKNPVTLGLAGSVTLSFAPTGSVVLGLTETGGFSREDELFGLGLAYNLIRNVGGTFYYQQEALGSTREKGRAALESKPNLRGALQNELRGLLRLRPTVDPYPRSFDGPGARLTIQLTGMREQAPEGGPLNEADPNPFKGDS